MRRFVPIRLFSSLPLLAVLAVLAGCAGGSDSTPAATTMNPGQQPPAPAATPHSSRISLDWPGTYSGVLPCASCPGIATTITLNADGSFERSMRYLDESPLPITEQGRFEWNAAGSQVILASEDGRSDRYQVGEHRLFHLDQEGRRIEGDLADHYVLEQHIKDPLLEGWHWRLVELQGERIDGAAGRQPAFIQFDAEAVRVFGSTSCNRFSGAYAVKTGQRLRLAENLAMTKMACPDMRIEDAFVRMLRMVENYSLGDDGTLTLNRARMAPLARFVAQAADEEG